MSIKPGKRQKPTRANTATEKPNRKKRTAQRAATNEQPVTRAQTRAVTDHSTTIAHTSNTLKLTNKFNNQNKGTLLLDFFKDKHKRTQTSPRTSMNSSTTIWQQKNLKPRSYAQGPSAACLRSLKRSNAKELRLKKSRKTSRGDST